MNVHCAPKTQLEMNAAAALAGLAGSPTPSTESMKGFLQLEKEMFGQNEVSFPMRVSVLIKIRVLHCQSRFYSRFSLPNDS